MKDGTHRVGNAWKAAPSFKTAHLGVGPGANVPIPSAKPISFDRWQRAAIMQASRVALTLLRVATAVGQRSDACGLGWAASRLLSESAHAVGLVCIHSSMHRPAHSVHDLRPSVADVLCRMQHLRSLLAPPRQHLPGGAACPLAWRQQAPASPLPPQPPQPPLPPQSMWFRMASRSPPAVAPRSSTRSCLYWAALVPARARRYVCELNPGPWRRALRSIWTALRCRMHATATITND